MKYDFKVSLDITGSKLDMGILHDSLVALFPANYTHINSSGVDDFSVYVDTILTTEEKTSLDNAVLSHTEDPLSLYRDMVTNAIAFFTVIMVQYAAENITMGITQAGKTKALSDYLADVMRYGQSGSLYEVINEINTLKTAGLPVDLAPWVTTARLDEFNAKITEYLS